MFEFGRVYYIIVLGVFVWYVIFCLGEVRFIDNVIFGVYGSGFVG